MADRSTKRSRRKKKRSVRWSRFLLVLFILAVIAGVGASAGMVLSAVRSMPELEDVRPQPQITSFVYDAEGENIGALRGSEHRIMVEDEDIPDIVREAFLAIEDHRFYQHFGLDVYRIAGAAWNNLTGGPLQGGSTISQQLARNAWPIGMEQTWHRKIQEAFLAIQLERSYTKDQILDMYLNQINLGHGAHGVQAASQMYFGKDVSDLTLAEASLLAGLPRAPEHYSPYLNKEEAVQRQELVLASMVREEFITEDEKNQALNEEIELVGFTSDIEGPAAHFIDYVISKLLERYPADKVYGGGLEIHTTLNQDVQSATERAVEEHINANFPLGEYEKDLQVAAVIMDPHTGHLQAIVGSRDRKDMLEHNRAWQSYRQPGSAFKPVAVYATALEAGWNPASIIDDAPVEITRDESRFVPRNYSESGYPLGAYRGLTTVREAIRRSVNVTAVRTLMEIGIDKGFDMAERLGITSLVPDGRYSDRNPSLALGGLTDGVSPMELTLAYSTFAAGGVRPEPIAITKVIDRHGNVLEDNQSQRTAVLEPEKAYLMTDMLKSVVRDDRSGWLNNWGTGWRAELSDGWPAAGKTGTTDDMVDIWWVGYTPKYAGTIWLGFDQPDNMSNILGVSMSSGMYPVLMWRDIMEVAHEGLTPTDFERPDNMIERTICIKSGKLPSDECPSAHLRRELFIDGTEPLQECDVHVVKEVCSEHPNLLWHELCPEHGEAEERAFLDRPIIEEPLVDTDGRTLPLPSDMGDAIPEETCVDVHGEREEEEEEEEEPLFPDSVEITMGHSTLRPTMVRVQQGEEVTLEIHSTDGSHRLVIEQLGVDVQVTEDEPASVTFTPEQRGRFRMICGDHYPEDRREQGYIFVQ